MDPLNPQEDEELKGLDIFDYAKDAVKGVAYGVTSFGQSVYNLADFLTADALPDTDFRSAAPDTILGGVIGGITQFTLGMLPGLGAARLAGLGSVASGAVAGSVADFLAFDPHEGRLANLLKNNAGLDNFVTDYLAADPNDGELEGRFKNVLEGAFTGLAMGGLGKLFHMGLKVTRARRAVIPEIIEKGLPLDSPEAAKILQKAANEAVPEEEIIKVQQEVLGLDKPTEASEAVLKDLEAKAEKLPKVPAGNARDILEMDELVTEMVYGKTPEELRLSPKTKGGETALNMSLLSGTDDILQGLHATVKYFGDRFKLSGKTMEQLHDPGEALADRLGMTIGELHQRSMAIAGTDQERRILQHLTWKLTGEQASLTRETISEYQMVYQKYQAGTVSQNEWMASMMAARIELGKLANVYEAFTSLRTGSGQNLRSLNHRVSVLKQVPNTDMAKTLREMLDAEVIDEFGNINNLNKILEDASALLSSDEGMKKFGTYMEGIRGKKLSVWNKINDWFINNLLSSPTTVVTNFVSPVATGILRSLQEGFGGAMRGDVHAVSDMVGEMADLVVNLKSQMDVSFDTFKSGRSTISPGSTKIDPMKNSQLDFLGQQRQAQGLRAPSSFAPEFHPDSPEWQKAIYTFLDKHITAPTRAIMASDELVTTAVSRSNLRKQIKRTLREQGVPENMIHGESLKQVDKHFIEGVLQTTRQGKERIMRETEMMVNAGMPADQAADVYTKRIAEFEASGIGSRADKALSLADEVAFKNDPAPKSLQASYAAMVSKHPVLRLITPFVKTPMNILSFAAREVYSPLQWIGQKSFKNVQALEHSRLQILRELADPDPYVQDLVRGRAAVATASMTAFATMAYNGRITGRGPIDPKQRRILQQAGWRPYSIKIGNRYISYERLDPLASVMGGIADMIHYGSYADEDQQDGIEDIFAGFMVAHMNNLTQKSYLTGIRNAVNALFAPEMESESYLQQMATSFVIPAAVNSVKNSVDPLSREARSMLDAFGRKIPGVSQEVEPYRNIFGEPIEATKRLGYDEIGGIMNIWMPIAYSEVSDDVVDKELAMLRNGFTPPKTSKGGVDLLAYRTRTGQTAFDRYQELVGTLPVNGKTIRDSMRAAIRSAQYQRLDPNSHEGVDSGRVGILRTILMEHREAAWQALQREMPEIRHEFNRKKRMRKSQPTGGVFGSLPFQL